MEEEEAAMMMVMMMSEEDCFREMAEDGVDRSYDEDLLICRFETSWRLREMEPQMELPLEERKHLTALCHLDWAECVHDTTVNYMEFLAGRRDECRCGAAHLAAKEPALAETLLGLAAWSDATRAGLEESAPDLRRLRGMCLSTVLGASAEDMVCFAADKFLAHAATHAPCDDADYSIPPAVFPYAAVVDRVDAAVALGARGPVFDRFLAGFAKMAGRLTRAAAEFQGEDTVKLRAHAATVEALCADTQTLLPKMVSSPSWEMWTYLVGRDWDPEATAHTAMDTTLLLDLNIMPPPPVDG